MNYGIILATLFLHKSQRIVTNRAKQNPEKVHGNVHYATVIIAQDLLKAPNPKGQAYFFIGHYRGKIQYCYTVYTVIFLRSRNSMKRRNLDVFYSAIAFKKHFLLITSKMVTANIYVVLSKD
jgi:hypothetical protein